MKKLIIYFLLILFNNAYANPIWEISNNWACLMKLHTITNKNGGNLRINSIKSTTTYDFENSKVSVIFDDGHNSTGTIIHKNYFENQVLNENIIVIDWKNWGPYVSIITERNNVFWTSKTSGGGSSDNKLHSAYKECYATD